ncbi:MAG: Holliday junction branch migration protein RuvA [Patescibacteria group bacterium]|nr:Holliday junction branch migration protein RuvA [Patescibacteria group bacterium]
MISYLKGKVIAKDGKTIILKVNDVGYKIFLGENFLNKIQQNDEFEIFTYLFWREDKINLYGFRENSQLGFFEKLISVSGVGPRSALYLLDIVGTKNIQQAIFGNQSDILTQAKGLGKKTAERIILELKNKLPNIDKISATPDIPENDEAISALINLGYNANDAREIIGKLPPEIKTVGDKIKAALKKIGR